MISRSEAETNNDTKIERLNALVQAGRTNWLAMLGYLAFIFVTVLSIADSDFFVPNRSTQLPLIGVTIPTLSFFIFAPLLGAALYVYTHFTIHKVIEQLANLPPRHQTKRPDAVAV